MAPVLDVPLDLDHILITCRVRRVQRLQDGLKMPVHLKRPRVAELANLLGEIHGGVLILELPIICR